MIIFDNTYHNYGYNTLIGIYRTFIGRVVNLTDPNTFMPFYSMRIDGLIYRSTDRSIIQLVHIKKVQNFKI